MKNKFPLQKFNIKTVAIVSISTVVVISGGMFILVPLLKSIFWEPKSILQTTLKPDHHLSVSKPELEPSSIYSSSKISKLCKAVDLCNVVEGGKSYIETDEKDLLVKKMHAWNELDSILSDSTLWKNFKSGKAVSNCLSEFNSPQTSFGYLSVEAICSCFDALTTLNCSS